MRKNFILSLLAVGVLLVAAVLLPERISRWSDSQLLDRPQLFSQEEREGFAESIQLSAPEKLMMIRSGKLQVMDLNQGAETPNIRLAVTEEEVEYYTDEKHAEQSVGAAPPEDVELGEEERDALTMAEAEKWSGRLTAVRWELRALQNLGGLPQLWSDKETLECTGRSEVLYIDRDTKVSFQVYVMSISCSPYSMKLWVDEQSGRILSLQLCWNNGDLNWAPRGPSTFSGAWRSYWGMDSVKDIYHGDNAFELLSATANISRINGDYAADAGITFSYDDTPIVVPLEYWSIRGRESVLVWNL